MGRVSTNNLREAKETGKIFLDKMFYSNLPQPIIIPRRCKYCKTPLRPSDYNNTFCDDWCREQEMIEYPKLGKCKGCGCDVKPFIRKSGVSSGVFPKYCKQCGPYGKKKTQNIK